ncbi:MAG: hypothetical protein JSU74_08255 [Candidatus Zixiibacteriota bacterium]|nr:MAG: hypothetical protein JSU74_08255 [candidate division Zixibacteria bacterium]
MSDVRKALSVKKFLLSQARSVNPLAFILFAPPLLFASLFGLYAFLNSQHRANISPYHLSQIEPDPVVGQKVIYPRNSPDPIVHLRTASGKEFDVGKHIPNFDQLKAAIQSGKKIALWYGDDLYLPGWLHEYFNRAAPPIYMATADRDVVLRFEPMKRYHEEHASSGYLFLIFPLIGFPLVVFLFWALQSLFRSRY